MTKRNELHLYLYDGDVDKNKGGRPPVPARKKLRTLTISLPPATQKVLKKRAKKEHMSVSLLVRLAVLEYLQK